MTYSELMSEIVMKLNRKEAYRKLCLAEHSIGLFSQDWWLDVACGEDCWDVSLVTQNNGIKAAMPFHITNGSIKMPPLTPRMGPWVYPGIEQLQDRLSKEIKMLNRLIAQLPEVRRFSQCFYPEMDNWLPFYWKGFQQTTRYTYRILNKSEAVLWDGFRQNIRRSIRKAQNRYHLHIEKSDDIGVFVELNRASFERQHRALPYAPSLLHKIYKAAKLRGQAEIYMAIDPDNQIHAAALIVFDKHYAYYLCGGMNEALKQSGAMSYCLHEAIKTAFSRGLSFDFEGSMIEPIEQFFRGFGAQQVPYFLVTKDCRVSFEQRAKAFIQSLAIGFRHRLKSI